MPDLNFQVYEAGVEPYAAAPLLVFKLGIANAEPDEPIHTVALRCQIQIEAARRRYSAEEQERLRDLFGEPERWSQTLRAMLWTHTSIIVTQFAGSAVVDPPVPCTFDFNVAATKYFAGLEGGEIPLCLQFSGTIFYEAEDGALQVAQIPWSKETRYRLPIRVWHDIMGVYYRMAPGSVCAATCLIACTGSKCGAVCRPRSKHWRACCGRPRRRNER